LVRDGLQVGVEDAAFGVDRLAVAIVVGFRVEAPGEFVLGLWGDFALVFEHHDVVVIQCVADGGELFV
jgi:hypothetical protein